MFQQNLTTSLLGIANVFVDKIENNSSSIQISLSTTPLPQKSKFVLVADKLQPISTITEHKRFGIYPFKAKKHFYCYVNAVTFVKPAVNGSLKSTTFCHGTDILQVECMLPF